jgi:hypothetical protein
MKVESNIQGVIDPPSLRYGAASPLFANVPAGRAA